MVFHVYLDNIGNLQLRKAVAENKKHLHLYQHSEGFDYLAFYIQVFLTITIQRNVSVNCDYDFGFYKTCTDQNRTGADEESTKIMHVYCVYSFQSVIFCGLVYISRIIFTFNYLTGIWELDSMSFS